MRFHCNFTNFTLKHNIELQQNLEFHPPLARSDLNNQGFFPSPHTSVWGFGKTLDCLNHILPEGVKFKVLLKLYVVFSILIGRVYNW